MRMTTDTGSIDPTRPRGRRRAALTIAGALVLASAFGAVASAPGPAAAAGELAAATGASDRTVGVGQGTVDEQPGTASAARHRRVTFFVGLRRPEGAARSAVRAVSTPGKAGYREFPSRTAIARDYGVSQADLATLRTQAEKVGVRVRVDATGVFARVTGTVAQLERFFGVGITVKHVGPGEVGYRLKGAPKYAKALRPVVTETVRTVLVTDTRKGASVRQHRSDPVPLPPLTDPQPSPTNAGTYTGCPMPPDMQSSVYSYGQLATAYGTAALRSQAGAVSPRLAIISLGDGFGTDMLATSAQCFGLGRSRFVRVPVDGLTGPLPQAEGEGDMDTQIAQAVLPAGSLVHVVESLSPSEWFLAFATAYSLPRLPDVASVSYGMCEPFAASAKEVLTDPRQWRTLTESVLLRLGLAGTTVLASAGDDGTSDCIEISQGTDARRAVDYPASSPNVLGVGGTRLVVTPDNQRVDEVTWNDSGFVYTDSAGQLQRSYGAGGGGSSTWFDRPSWQPRSAAGSAARSLPDVALHASGAPGWPIAIDLVSGSGPSWSAWAGTSAATPYTAANLALMAAMERKAGRGPFGQIAPALYSLYAGDRTRFYARSAFDVTQGENDEYDIGCCTAGVGYDQATGLGVLRFDTLLPQLRTLARG